jgi:hypothetical protein
MSKVEDAVGNISAGTNVLHEDFKVTSIYIENDIINVHLGSFRDLEQVEGEVIYRKRGCDTYPWEARKVIPAGPRRYETRFFVLVKAEEKTA